MSTQVARSIVNPSCVSLSDTFLPIPAATMRSKVARYARVAASASGIVATLSPSRSRVCIRPLASMFLAATIASSIVSPAMNRRAKLFGLDAPTKSEHKVTTELDEQIEELLAEMEKLADRKPG